MRRMQGSAFKRAWLACSLTGLSGLLTGCLQQPTGDFGRTEPSIIHDKILPTAGRMVAQSYRNELGSSFNLTDDEKVLRDKAWPLIRPANADHWYEKVLVEAWRTRILPRNDMALDRATYYRWLRSEQFASSHGRYVRLASDIAADEQQVQPFFDQAERVLRADRERLNDAHRLRNLSPKELREVYGRIDENRRLMAWVWRALHYRYQSYDHALQRLRIETPSDQVLDVSRALQKFGWTIKNPKSLQRMKDIGPINGRTPIPSRLKAQSYEKPKPQVDEILK